MSTNNTDSSILLEMKNVSIEGYSDEKWHPIINEVDLGFPNLINLIGKLQKTTKYLFFLTTENLGYEVFNDLISQYKEIKISDFDNNEIISKKLLTSNIFVLKNFNYENWIQIIKCSKKVITPESGCTHIASAFNVHTIVIYNYDNLPEYIYREYGPWKYSDSKLVFAKNNDINFQITSLID